MIKQNARKNESSSPSILQSKDLDMFQTCTPTVMHINKFAIHCFVFVKGSETATGFKVFI